MKKVFIFTVMMLQLFVLQLAAQSSMTDQQVLDYTKQALQSGKSQTEIAKELTLRGVTKEQALRVKALYEKESNAQAAGTEFADQSIRTRNNVKELTDEDVSLGEFLEDPFQEDSLQQGELQMMPPPVPREEQIFGHDVFNSRRLTFEPSVNLATPPNYRLGPDDEVIVDIWGASQTTIRERISPEGTVHIAELGPIGLSGLTVMEAEAFLKGELSKIYADASNQIRVTLGGARTILINVMGEVMQPGTYSLSAFSSVFHALYRAGGVNELGTLRNVQLIRNGKKYATIDIYEFILNGKLKDDIRLDEGDVIIVPAYESIVKITGNVKRPMRYELRSGESLGTLIKYAGGFTSQAYTDALSLVRQTGREYQVKTVDKEDFDSFKMCDGDELKVEAILNRFSNRLEIRGAVYRPGFYELNSEVSTVKALVQKAEGLMEEAFLGRAVLYRTREDLTREVKQIDIKGLLDGTQADVALQKNDVLFIPSIHDLIDLGNVTIHGEVTHPGEYPFADNMTLEDLIIGAGGLKEAASTVRVDVARRIKDPTGTEVVKETSKMFSFALKDGFVVQGEPGFVLEAYDHVYVRRSPAYQEQKNVTVDGDVLYNGNYSLTVKNERLSDVIAKAGGVTEYAYTRGARLSRLANDEEKARMKDVMDMMSKEIGEGAADSLGLEVISRYTVGIDLEAALASPGGDDDLVLREGDIITVPEYTNTVRVSGAVMMSNTIAYDSRKGIDYYLSQAGGYSQNAKKSKKFIVYMNGHISEVKGNGRSQIEPGCEIIVPSKRDKAKNMQSFLAYATSFASLGTMIASIANIIK